MDGYVARKERFPTKVSGHLYRSGGSRLAVIVSEMSGDGCRLECDESLSIGEPVRIAMPGMGSVRAKIRWSLGGAAGARFDMTDPC